MSKKIIIPNSLKQIDDIKNLCDGFILGIKNLSVNLPYYFSLNEIENIIKKYPDKNIFVSVNKNMHNVDLDNLSKTLKKLSELKISGIIFYDISVVNLNKKYNLNLNLIWNQEHLVTNYNTINYWNNHGTVGSYLSSELTLEEITKIRENTNCLLMMNVFGYIPMFTSKRPLVNNYLETFNLSSDSKIHYLEKENNTYPITSYDITTIYSSKIVNLANDLQKLFNIDYLIFNSFNIDADKFIQIMKLFNEVKKDNSKVIFDKINMLLDYNIDTGFLYKDTVYKVKKNG